MIAIDTNLLIYAHREDSPWSVFTGADETGEWPGFMGHSLALRT